MKKPDYIITEFGCPKWNYETNKTNDNNNKWSMTKSACCNNLCGNQNNNVNSFNNNNTCKLAKLLTEKSRKLLPLRETLTECYTRLLIVNNDHKNKARDCSYIQEQKSFKNKQNEYIKEQQRKKRDNYINSSDRYISSARTTKSTTTTPTSNAYIRFNPTTLDLSYSATVESDLDVF